MRFAFLASFVLVLGTASAARAELDVVATLPDLAAIVAAVGGEHVAVQALADPRQDPHFVDPRPSYIVALNQADLLVLNGLELEVGWLPPLLSQARNPAINPGQPGYLDASVSVERLDVPAAGVTRAQGDVHLQGNPHYLYSPIPALAVVDLVRDRLSQLDPDHAGAFAANASALSETLRALADEQAARFAALPESSRQIVAYHASLAYLTDWLGLTTLIHVEPLPGTPPNPGHVATVLGTMRSSGARVVVQEEFYPTNTSETLVAMAGGSVVVLEGGTRRSDGQSYVDHLRAQADALFEALSSAAEVTR